MVTTALGEQNELDTRANASRDSIRLDSSDLNISFLKINDTQTHNFEDNLVEVPIFSKRDLEVEKKKMRKSYEDAIRVLENKFHTESKTKAEMAEIDQFICNEIDLLKHKDPKFQRNPNKEAVYDLSNLKRSLEFITKYNKEVSCNLETEEMNIDNQQIDLLASKKCLMLSEKSLKDSIDFLLKKKSEIKQKIRDTEKEFKLSESAHEEAMKEMKEKEKELEQKASELQNKIIKKQKLSSFKLEDLKKQESRLIQQVESIKRLIEEF